LVVPKSNAIQTKKTWCTAPPRPSFDVTRLLRLLRPFAFFDSWTAGVDHRRDTNTRDEKRKVATATKSTKKPWKIELKDCQLHEYFKRPKVRPPRPQQTRKWKRGSDGIHQASKLSYDVSGNGDEVSVGMP
jgi:hypothetical protein